MSNYYTAPEAEQEAALARWYAEPIGQSLVADISTMVKRLSHHIPGQSLTCLGINSFGRLFDRNHTLEKQLLFQQMLYNPDIGNIHLPLDNHSQDCLVLAHALDLSDTPYALLRETERVVGYGSHLIVIGFNQLSLWGSLKPVLAWRNKLPWTVNFYSSWRVADWLRVLGFQIHSVQSLHYLPLVGPAWLKRGRVINRIGRSVLPRMGNVYLLHAKKQTVPLNPLRHRWTGREAITAPPLATGSTGVAGLLNRVPDPTPDQPQAMKKNKKKPH